jgi:hypothetical protein
MATSHPPLRPIAAAATLALGLLSPLAAAQGSATPPPADAPAKSAEAPARPEAIGEAPARPEAIGEAPGPDGVAAWEREAPVRRSGFTVGVAGGVILGSAAGFPNDVKKIGLERYYTETGLGVGGGGMLWIGGALTDWLTFGVALGSADLTAGDNTVSNSTFMFHLETFPLFPLGGLWREVGVTLDTGVGTSITTDGSEDTLIDGGAVSHIGGGVFYEGIRLWKVSMGPCLYGDYSWGLSVRQPGLLVGWRTALYTGSVATKK